MTSKALARPQRVYSKNNKVPTICLATGTSIKRSAVRDFEEVDQTLQNGSRSRFKEHSRGQANRDQHCAINIRDGLAASGQCCCCCCKVSFSLCQLCTTHRQARPPGSHSPTGSQAEQWSGLHNYFSSA